MTWAALNNYAKLKLCCSDKWNPAWSNILIRFARVGLPTSMMRFAAEGSLYRSGLEEEDSQRSDKVSERKAKIETAQTRIDYTQMTRSNRGSS